MYLCPPLYTPGVGILVGYKVGVLIGLHGRVLVGLQRNPSRSPTSLSLRVASLRVPGDLSLTSICMLDYYGAMAVS
jgi:hypothetical protein